MTDAIDNVALWTDHVYPTTLRHPARRSLPMKTVTGQRSWRDDIANRVRWQLRDMLPHDFRMVEGVEVRKISHKCSGFAYKVNGASVCLGFDSAVAAVVAAVGEREEGRR